MAHMEVPEALALTVLSFCCNSCLLMWKITQQTTYRAPGTHWIGGLVGPRAGDTVGKRKISCPCQESNPGCPTCSLFLCQLLYSVLLWNIPYYFFPLLQVVDIVLHCLDPGHLKVRGLSEVFPAICRFNQVSHCASTRRIAVGAKNGQVALYELRSQKCQVVLLIRELWPSPRRILI
jgi:hypothetical protein